MWKFINALYYAHIRYVDIYKWYLIGDLRYFK